MRSVWKIPGGWLWWLGVTVTLVPVALYASVAQGRPVTVGFLYDVHAANVWTLPECTSPRGLEVNLVQFKQFAEVQRAFQTGNVDFASMGYQNLAQLEDAGFTDYKAVSGVYTGGEHITLRKGVRARTWKDLEGLRVGVPPNSFVQMLFLGGAEENGLDVRKVNFVYFAGGGPPLLAALERGDIDAMVSWEPNSARAKVYGIGDYSPFGLQGGRLGYATGVMYASGSLIRSNPAAVQTVVDCTVDRSRALTANPERWIQYLFARTGLTREIAETAIGTGKLDSSLYQEAAERIIQIFAANGILKDFSQRVSQRFDYTFLEKATGRSACELGKKC